MKLLRRLTERAHLKRMRKNRSASFMVERLEPRVMLSADNAIAGVSDALSTGFNAVYGEMSDLVANNEVFDNYVPGILTTQTNGDSTITVSPTLREAIEIDVDVYTDGDADSGFGSGIEGSNSLENRYEYIRQTLSDAYAANLVLPESFFIENALDAMDINEDHKVSVSEAYGVLVLGQINYIVQNEVFFDTDGEDGLEPGELRSQLNGYLNYMDADVYSVILPYVPWGLPSFLTGSISMNVSSTSASPGSDILFNMDVTLTLVQNDQVDLGYEADALHISFDSEDTSTSVPVSRTIDFGSFIFGFNGATDGAVDPDGEDFYFAVREEDGMRFAVDIGEPGNPVSAAGMEVNVGFLGTTVQDVSGDGFMLDMDLTGFADDPSNPDALGFITQPMTGTGSITADAEPESITEGSTVYSLPNDIIFTLKFGTQSFSPTTEITVEKWNELGLGSFTIDDLADHVEGSIDDILGDAGLITVTVIDGKLRFSLPSVNPGQLGFGAEVSGTGSIEADLISTQIGRISIGPGAVQAFSFLLSVGGQTPKLVTVYAEPITFIDPGYPTLPFYLLTKANLIDQVQDALDTAFGASVVTASDIDDDGQISLSAGTGVTLEITHTLTLDTVEEITIAELEDAEVFKVEPDSASRFTVDLSLKADEGLHEVGTAYDYQPEGTISVDIDPFDQGLLSEGHDLEVIFLEGDPDTGISVPRARYELTFGGDMDPEAEPSMLYFNLVTAENMIGLIDGLGLALENLGNSGTFANYDIPFADASFSDLFIFRELIETSLLFDDGGDGIDGAAADTELLLEKFIAADDTTYLLPSFDTAQDLAVRLSEILNVALTGAGGINAKYDTVSHELTYDVELLSNYRVSPGLGTSLDAPFEFDVDLSPFTQLSVDETGPAGSADVSLTGSTALSTTFGIDLSPPGKVIYEDTLLKDLNGGDGIDIKTESAITGENSVRTVYGLRNLRDNTLVARDFNVNDAHFGLRFDFTSDVYHVTISAAETADNLSLAALVTDIQDAIDEALDGSGYEGDVVVGYDAYGRLTLDKVSPGSIEIFTDETDPIVTELGFKSPVQVGNVLVAQKRAPVLVGRLTGNASFDISVNGAPSQTVLIYASSTYDNVSIADLVADINNALVNAGLGDDIVADFDRSATHGTRLVLSATDPGTEFDITGYDLDGFAESQLGLTAPLPVTSTRADFVIVDRNGLEHPILMDALDPEVNTVDDLILLINAQAGGAVTAEINSNHNGLRLIDHTGGSGQLRVETINGSGVALQLGLIGTGSSADENKIEGGSVGLTTLDDRFFVENTEIFQGLMLETPDSGVNGQGLFGLIGVDVNFDGSLFAELSTELKNPNAEGDTGIGGKVTLAELFDDPDSVVDTPTVGKVDELAYDNLYDVPGFGEFQEGSLLRGYTSGATAVVLDIERTIGSGTMTLFHIDGTFLDNEFIYQEFSPTSFAAADANGTVTEKENFGEFTLGVTVQDGFGEFGFGDGLKALNGLSFDVPVSLIEFGNPYDPEEPVATLVESAYDALVPFEDINYSHIYSALEELQNVLVDVDTGFDLLSAEIPGIGKSVSDILNLVDGFTRGVENTGEVFDEAAFILENSLDVPALRLQDIPGALRGAFGLLDGIDPDASDAVDWVRLDFDESGNMLLVDMNINKSISTKLGLDINLDQGLPNLTSGGVLQATGSLDMNLNFGIDLSNPEDAYLFDTSSIAGNLDVEGAGADGMGLVFRASIGPLAVFIQDGDALVDVAFSLPGLNFGGSDRKLIRNVDFSDWKDKQTISDNVNIVLPMYYGGEGPNDFVDEFSASGSLQGGLSLNIPDFSEIEEDILSGELEYDPFDNILLAFDEIDFFLESVEDMISGQVLATKLPFVGDQLADVLFIEDFRNILVRTLRDGVENAINPNPDTIINDLLNGLFSPGGLLEGYLIGPVNSSSDVTSGDINDWYRQWNFTLGNVGHPEIITVDDFDIGIPSLGLDIDIPVEIEFTWSLDFAFGVNFVEGAYIDLSNADEMEIDLNISFKDPAAIGYLGFLQFNASDLGSGVSLGFDVDIQKDNVNSPLGFSDLGAVTLDTRLEGSPLSDHAINFNLDAVIDGFSAALPRITTDFILDWSLSETPLASLGTDAVLSGLDKIAFENIGLDAGSLLTDVLGPVLSDIQEYISPFMPVVDVLTEPIPILSDLAGEPFTILDLAEIFGDAEADEFIEAVADMLDLINAIGSASVPVISLGNLTIYDSNPSHTDAGFNPADPDSGLSDIDLSGLSDTQLDELGLDTAVFYGAIEGNTFLKDLQDGKLVDGLSMPILTDIVKGIDMLLGRETTIMDYKTPDLAVSFDYLQVFPVWGPLAVSIEISFGFGVDLHSIGFDTYGLERFADSGFRNPGLIFDGFYFNDLEDGVDQPEVMFEFGLVGAAELYLGVARGGVAGGIDATIFLDWHDSIPDGHVHFSEIAGNLASNPEYGLLAIFDLGGALTFQLFAFLEIPLFGVEEEFPITPETELFSFDIDLERTPVLATDLENGTLQLNMGPNAEDRLNGDTSDGHEEFFVKWNGGDSVSVWSDKLGVNESDAQEFSGIDHIVGLGGQGNDVIELRNFDGSNITGDFEGGAGDDRIEYVGSSENGNGPGAVILGGVGNDILTGGSLNDTIFGGEGNDTINGGGGYDILFGDQGRYGNPYISSRIDITDGIDVISGGDGDDVIFGGGGNDILDGNAGNDVIIGDGGRFEYTKTGGHIDVEALRPATFIPVSNFDADPIQISKEIDAIYDEVVDVFLATDLGYGGNDDISGGGDNDIILGGSGDDTINGGSGDDVILGGKGFDEIYGGAGADTIFGNDQADIIAGNAGADVISGGFGNDSIHGNTGNDVMKGGRGADVMYGDEDDDQVFGQSDPDILFGGTGDDFVVGGTGNDIMFGDDGLVAKLDPADGSVSFYVGIGSLTLLNGEFYDDNIRTLDIIVTDVVAGDGDDILSGDAGDDYMLGGGGNDLMGGDVDPRSSSAGTPTEIGEDILIGDGGKINFDSRHFKSVATVIGEDTTGEPFDDIIYGDNGKDYIFGGRGNDFLFGGHGKVVSDTTIGSSRGATDIEADDNDIIIGDNGEILFDFGLIAKIQTTDVDEDTGGHDYAEGQLGYDVILGGVNGSPDILNGNDGDDVILGDNGVLDFAFDGDTDLDTLDLIRSLPYGDDTDEILGGGDVISGSAGRDVLIGGTGGDTMYGDDESASNGAMDHEDIMLGDNADIFLIGTEGSLKVQVAEMTTGTAVDRIVTTDDEEETGGADTMSGNASADIIVGGVNHGGQDDLYGDSREPDGSLDDADIMLGDNAELDWTYGSDTDRMTLDLITTKDYSLGGRDNIYGNAGDDITLGGTGGDLIIGDNDESADAKVPGAADTLESEAGSDILIGDQGWLKYVLGNLSLIESTDSQESDGGVDYIEGNDFDDVIMGGVLGDILIGESQYGNVVTQGADYVGQYGNDIMLGDEGRMRYNIAASETIVSDLSSTVDTGYSIGDNDPYTLDLIETFATGNISGDPSGSLGGADWIFGNEGADIAIGGTDGDAIYGDFYAELALDPGIWEVESVTPARAPEPGQDRLIGDGGQITYYNDTTTLVRSIEPEYGGFDVIQGNDLADTIVGGQAGDWLYGEAPYDNLDLVQTTDTGGEGRGGNDWIIGDNGRLDYVLVSDMIDGRPDVTTVTLDGSPINLDRISTTDPTFGGNDVIRGNAADDVIFGGTGEDRIWGDTHDDYPDGYDGSDGNDLIFGDNGKIYPTLPSVNSNYINNNFFAIDTNSDDDGGDDVMFGNAANDTMLGQQGDDIMFGGTEDDILIGGHNISGTFSDTDDEEAHDELDDMDQSQQDAVLSGELADKDPSDINDINDVMDGGSDEDLMAGDNAIVIRQADSISPRYRLLTESEIYQMVQEEDLGGLISVDTGFSPNIDEEPQLKPESDVGYTVVLLDHSFDIEHDGAENNSDAPRVFGNDVMAGGSEDDTMFGQLGDDIMQGDGAVVLQDNTTAVPFDPSPGADPSFTIPDDQSVPDYFEIVDKELNADLSNSAYLNRLYFYLSEQETDGDDYMEGNGGNDRMYGNLGQDDMIGGSSSLFGLDTNGLPDGELDPLRPDGADLMYGGAGNPDRLERNAQIDPETGDGYIYPDENHGRDADVMLGDNANIYRLIEVVDESGATAFLTFNYDQITAADTSLDPDGYSIDRPIIPRAVELLDYQYSLEFDGTNVLATFDAIGYGDLMYGETGDDIIFGMTGDDVIFGNSDDDDLYGQQGNDWISGGTGEDGILGDDGLILTSRNDLNPELLYGIDALHEDQGPLKPNEEVDTEALNAEISTPGNIQRAIINIENELKKTVNLISFNLENDDISVNDILYGGLGSDWIHAGEGDDAVSGAEALPFYYNNETIEETTANELLQIQQQAPANPGMENAEKPFWFEFAPYNPGDILRYEGNTITDPAGDPHGRTRQEFALYDEFNPRRKIMLDLNGEAVATQDEAIFDFLLNFDETEGPDGYVFSDGSQPTDGDDKIFGDLGNDWIVGGSGRDDIWGGRGDDLLNMDDNHNSGPGGRVGPHDEEPDPLDNTQSDEFQAYADIAYGGAGRDVLILNTGADRAIDWVGEYNSYIVPFSPFGEFDVSRTLQPQLPEYLYALSENDGTDTSIPDGARYIEQKTADVRVDDPSLPEFDYRLGEPYGEIGMVLQTDFDWQNQTGAPNDPQPGNLQGKREIMRRELFTDETSANSRFAPDIGTWLFNKDRYLAAPESLGEEAVSIYYLDMIQPSYMEILATVNADKDRAGLNSNAYIIFDYQSATDFKFAGIDAGLDKLRIGHRTADGWIIDTQVNMQLLANIDYNLTVVLYGTVATLYVNESASISFDFGSPLNTGYIGLGTDNAKAKFDNWQVQKLPPTITFEYPEDFSNAVDNSFTPVVGNWQISPEGHYTGSVTDKDRAIALQWLDVAPYSLLEFEATIQTPTIGGFVFDYYSPDDFKFAAMNADSNKIIIGHYTSKGWNIDAEADYTIDSNQNYKLGISLFGSSINVTMNDEAVVGYVFNSLLNDGGFGLLSSNGSSTFDDFAVRGDDPALAMTLPPVVSISDVEVNEGDNGSGSVFVTISLSKSAEVPVSIDYVTSDGSAVAGEDYQTKTGTVTLAPGQTSVQVEFIIIDDALLESNETFNIELSNPVNVQIGDSAGIVTIIDNDAIPSVSVSDVSVYEGDSGLISAFVEFSLSEASDDIVTIDYATIDGTALSGIDYQAQTGTVTFTPGQTHVQVEFFIKGDEDIEMDEMFTIELSNPVGAQLDDNTAVVTVLTDDAVPVVNVLAPDTNASEAGPETGVFIISRDRTKGELPVTLAWSGSAVMNDDFLVTVSNGAFDQSTGILTMPDGVGSVTLTITPVDDTAAEGPEDIILTVLPAPGYQVGSQANASVTITDDDTALPSLSVEDIVVTEGNKNNNRIVVTVVLSEPSSEPASVTLSTKNGTALWGEDYRALETRIYFNPGETTKNITIRIIGDKIDEPTEYFELVLSDPLGAIIADEGSGIVTILDS